MSTGSCTHLEPICSHGSNSHAASAAQQLLDKNFHQLAQKGWQMLIFWLAVGPTGCWRSIRFSLCSNRGCGIHMRSNITATVSQNGLQ